MLRGLDGRVDELVATEDGKDRELAAVLSELRLVKDDHEIAQIEEAVAATVQAFEDVVRALPDAIRHERGERWIEGTFNRRARAEGNDVGYGSICACGPHATILHWERNDGPVRPDQLLLLDAGVESRELYTADVTRTLPIGGRWSATQRARSTRRCCPRNGRPSRRFGPGRPSSTRTAPPWKCSRKPCASGAFSMSRSPSHCRRTWRPKAPGCTGAGRCTARRTCSAWTSTTAPPPATSTTGTGCSRRAWCSPIEPGLYFQPDDLRVPARFRGIGVRIEDDVVVTADGCRVLSAALPTDPDEIEEWMARLQAGQPAQLS